MKIKKLNPEEIVGLVFIVVITIILATFLTSLGYLIGFFVNFL